MVLASVFGISARSGSAALFRAEGGVPIRPLLVSRSPRLLVYSICPTAEEFGPRRRFRGGGTSDGGDCLDALGGCLTRDRARFNLADPLADFYKKRAFVRKSLGGWDLREVLFCTHENSGATRRGAFTLLLHLLGPALMPGDRTAPMQPMYSLQSPAAATPRPATEGKRRL